MAKEEKIGIIVVALLSAAFTALIAMAALSHNPQMEYTNNPLSLITLLAMAFFPAFVGGGLVSLLVFFICRVKKQKVSYILSGIIGSVSFFVFLIPYLFSLFQL